MLEIQFQKDKVDRLEQVSSISCDDGTLSRQDAEVGEPPSVFALFQGPGVGLDETVSNGGNFQTPRHQEMTIVEQGYTVTKGHQAGVGVADPEATERPESE